MVHLDNGSSGHRTAAPAASLFLEVFTLFYLRIRTVAIVRLPPRQNMQVFPDPLPRLVTSFKTQENHVLTATRGILYSPGVIWISQVTPCCT